ncbi:ABC transporter ATP-binding protein [Candidatus Obscuribacterales bacterium]|nr:ABC transporter ATP-binding protein [Candidatus Obscuribacterales bacterium]
MFSGAPPVHLMWSNMFDPKKQKIEKPINWSRITNLFRPYAKEIVFVLICVLFISVLGLLPPLLSMWLIDKAIPSGNFTMVMQLVAAMIATALVGALVGVAQGYFNATIGEGIMRDLRVNLMAHMHRMPLEFFTNTKTGEIMNRVSNDVDSIDGLVSGTLVSMVTNFITIATTLVTILWLDWRLALVSILVIPFMVFPMWPVGRKMYEIRRTTRQKRDEIHAIEQETLSVSGIMLLKSFVRETYERDRFHNLSTDLMKTEINLAMVGRWFMAAIAAMVTIGPSIIWLAGGWLCIKEGVTVGTVVSFVALLTRLYTPAAALAGVQAQIVSALAVFERIFDYLDMHEESTKTNGLALEKVNGDIKFENVSFSYTDRADALKNVTISIEAGQVAALVGPSGAGKTTMTMLVPRFYEPQDGTITLDGRDITSIGLSELRKHIGIVTQETYLFHDTIKNNLRYAKPDATDEQIEAATRAANIHDFIAALPNGYESIVGERGHKLSGGERQRLAIARVLLKNPRVLIFDEATSSLDSENETLIQAALVPLMKGRTSLVIAHRLSTIQSADKIFVVEGGEVVESGDHTTLLAKNGLYSRLYKQQFREGA